MCLSVYSFDVAREADTNITAYKVLRRIPDKYVKKFLFFGKWEYKYEAPFRRGYSYELNSKVKIDNELKSKRYMNDAYGHYQYGVFEGLHCMQDQMDAELIADELQCENPYNEYVVVEVMIPRGAKFFSGRFNGERGYASNLMLIGKPVYVAD